MTTVIYHSADYDGIFCREIARKFLPDAELIGWNFGDKPLKIPSTPIFVLDLPLDEPFGFKYKPGDAHGPQHPPGLVWIDHHKSSIDSHPKDIAGYRIDGVAACRLAWQWFKSIPENSTPNFAARGLHETLPSKQNFINREVSEPIAVRLAGEYDIWDKRDTRAEVLQYGLRVHDLTVDDWSQLLTTKRPSIEELESLISVGHDHDLLEPDGTGLPDILWTLLDHGKIAQSYAQKIDADLVTHRSYRLKWEGLDFLVLNTGKFNSLTFAALDKPETGHDALLGYMFNGQQWVVSLYHSAHRKDIDLSIIAVKHGGGGHRGACGFTCKTLPF